MITYSPKIPLLSWRSLLVLVVVLLAAVVIVPQVPELQTGFAQILHADPLYIGLALASICMAVVASGGTYTYLALRKVRFFHAVVVQTAGMFVNRLLPAGVGGLGLNTRFLYTHKHSMPQAAAVALMNNTLTGVGHAVLLGAVIVVASVALPEVRITAMHLGIALGGVMFVIVLFGLGKYVSLPKRVQNFIKTMIMAVGTYKNRKRYMVYALIFALLNTSGHMLALYWITAAFDVQLSLAVVVLVLTGGVVAASVTPTPGGVVGAEAALAAGLISFQVNSVDAIAIAVSYRIVSYWVPLLPGVAAFYYAQKQKLI